MPKDAQKNSLLSLTSLIPIGRAVVEKKLILCFLLTMVFQIETIVIGKH